jgi:hypothetical protein
MPKAVWMGIAVGLAAAKYGWIGAVALIALEAAWQYASGFYEAWKDDLGK